VQPIMCWIGFVALTLIRICFTFGAGFSISCVTASTGVEKSWFFRRDCGRLVGSVCRGDFVVEWRIKLEARSGWGEVETIDVARFKRRLVGLAPEEIGLSHEESKQVLAELQRLVLQT
jgi:hypothetical protein